MQEKKRSYAVFSPKWNLQSYFSFHSFPRGSNQSGGRSLVVGLSHISLYLWRTGLTHYHRTQQKSILLFCLFFGMHLTVLRNHSWLCLWDHEMRGIESWLLECKSCIHSDSWAISPALQKVLFLQEVELMFLSHIFHRILTPKGPKLLALQDSGKSLLLFMN